MLLRRVGGSIGRASLRRRRCGALPQQQPLCAARHISGEPIGSIFDPVTGPFAVLLTGVHDVTGLPWWATIAATALGIRAALLPVLFMQLHATAPLARTMPHISYLSELLWKDLGRLHWSDVAGRMGKIRSARKGVDSALKLNKASILKAFASPLTHIPVFVTFVITSRRMINEPGNGMDTGGMLWFVDLTAQDPYFALPVLAVTSTYLNLEYGFSRSPGDPPSPSSAATALSAPGSGAKGPSGAGGASGAGPVQVPGSKSGEKYTLYFKDFLQTSLIVLTPWIVELPQGAFIYWITSSTFSAVQTAALRNPEVRERLGLPSLGPQR